VLSSGRLWASLGASAVVHALALALIIAPRLGPPDAIIHVTLLPVGGAGGGDPALPAGAPGPLETTAVAAPPAPAPAQRRTPAKRVVARARVEPAPSPARDDAGDGAAPVATIPGDGLAGGGGGGGGGGDGTDGSGSGGALVDYDTNPRPPYPVVAQRLHKEGVVTLSVLVAADGRPEEVRVLESSGFPPLDESAVSTVRARWRFVPARRNGTPVADRVTVPIRFRLQGSRS
jgi:protein TonB